MPRQPTSPYECHVSLAFSPINPDPWCPRLVRRVQRWGETIQTG